MPSTHLTPQNDKALGADGQRVEHTVLYVEDHPVNVLLMQALFAKRPNTRLVVATTGEAGMQAAMEETPQLFLLDLRLPDCHGVELLQRLRRLPGLEQVPAVAVTAEDTRSMTPGGFAEIWHKPMDLHLTLARLDRLLELPAAGRLAAPPARAEHVVTRRHSAPPQPIPFPAVAAEH